jgi:hypothetical protein
MQINSTGSFLLTTRRWWAAISPLMNEPPLSKSPDTD